MTGWIVAVHIGAGYHHPDNEPRYKQTIKSACEAARTILSTGGSACAACAASIAVMEDDPGVNAGVGSNLSFDGTVECDASIMLGTGGFGAVGAAAGLKNPIEVARGLLEEESCGLLPLGRIPPIFLAGEGARQWAAKRGMPVASDAELEAPTEAGYQVVPSSLQQWNKYRGMVAAHEAATAATTTTASGASGDEASGDEAGTRARQPDDLNSQGPPSKKSRSEGGASSLGAAAAGTPPNGHGDVMHDTVGAVVIDSQGSFCSNLEMPYSVIHGRIRMKQRHRLTTLMSVCLSV